MKIVTTEIRRRRWPAAMLVVASFVLALAAPTAAHAAPTTILTTSQIAQPMAGGKHIYVSSTGSDMIYEGSNTFQRYYCLNDGSMWGGQTTCPQPTIDRPLRTIQTAVRIAKPGDVIVVRGGTYAEAIGWSAKKAYWSAPIVLQSYPGETVVVAGTLILKGADYWTIKGIRFTYNSAVQTGQSVVVFAGGRGWTFANNEVSGSRGVANLLIEATAASSTSTGALTEAAPRDYRVVGNCIKDNRGTGAHGTNHNIYLMASIYSTGGLIERNLIAGAPRGANIKAAGSSPSTANGSPRNVSIRNNTLLYGASGITVGLKSENVLIDRNLIALPSNSQQYDGGVKTYQLANPSSNAVRDTMISGYAVPIREDYGVTKHIWTARNTTSPVTFSGSVANCSVRAASTWYMAKYGQFSA